MTEPFLKWAGGKRLMVDQLLPLALERSRPGGWYVEPFLGAGAVALSVSGRLVSASDACEPLISTWRALVTDASGVSQLLTELAADHSESYYYQVRAWVPDSSVETAARFIYLNKAGFNGLYRTNASGQFNVPFGSRRASVTMPSPNHLADVGRRARRWKLDVGDFEQAIDRTSRGDVVYADPPYDGTFSYSSKFSTVDRARLVASLQRAAHRGVGVVATDADTPLTRELYSWARVSDVSERRSVSADASRRASAPCVLAVSP